MVSDGHLRVSADRLHRQVVEILGAWGMHPGHAETTAEVLVAANMAGIDTHGVALLQLYEQQIRSGKVQPAPEFRTVSDLGAVFVCDAGGGFGQAPSMLATDMAIERARSYGLGAAAVRNSNHYGAAGIYARRMADAGLVGISTSSVWRPAIVPTGGSEPKLGTNPFAFAAPASGNRPFLLDMATSAVAIGKLKMAARTGSPVPEGWAITSSGRPQCNPTLDLIDTLLLPLGGDRLHGGHKGYGLASMVEILSSVLSGAAITPLRDPGSATNDVGHFFMALDPGFFREDADAFRADVDRLMDALRATPPADPDMPVMVAGDPEYQCEADRGKHGIPVTAEILEEVRGIAQRAAVPFLLQTEEA